MSFQAYLDSVKAQTGKTPDDFKRLAAEKGLVRFGDILDWLKSEFGLGTGHARAIVHVIQEADKPKVSRDEAVAKHFAGAKAVWQQPYDALLEKLRHFGSDVTVSPTSSYISILRKDRKFAVVQVTARRLDIGIKRKGIPFEGRFEESGSWNNMVTHRVRIDDASQMDAELMAWLREAYENA
jgi:predicted transport protein